MINPLILFPILALITFLILVLVVPSKTDGLSKALEQLTIFSFGKVRKALGKRKKTNQSLKMSEPFYNALASISIQVAIENVLLRYDEQTNKIQVWLAPRHDQIYQQTQWHCPGSMLRPTDKLDSSFPDAFERVLKRELKIETYAQLPILAGMIMSDTPRGSELSLVYLCQSKQNPKGEGQFFDVVNLPTNVIKHHHIFIEMATNKYKQIQRSDYLVRG